jgi:hypothetical protein
MEGDAEAVVSGRGDRSRLHSVFPPGGGSWERKTESFGLLCLRVCRSRGGAAAGRCARSAATAWAPPRRGTFSPPATSAGSPSAAPATSTSARTAPRRARSARPSTSATRVNFYSLFSIPICLIQLHLIPIAEQLNSESLDL